MTVNAMMPGALAPQLDLVGPTVDDDVRRLVARYGSTAVKEAATRLTKAKRGPKTLPDWRELKDVIETDAREWLAGGDPISARSNYAIAKEFAENRPGQSAISTHQRIERKLAKRSFGRRWHMLVTAMNLSHKDYSWTDHIRTLEALETLPDPDWQPIWDFRLKMARNNVSDYTVKWGSPADDLTIREVEEGARKSVPSPSGLAGFMGQQLDGYSPLAKILAQAVSDPGSK